MKGTDIFNLGENWHIYVNTVTYLNYIQYNGITPGGIPGIITQAYIGENKAHPLKISGVKFSACGDDFSKSPSEAETVSKAKSKLANIILQHKELLIEYIKNQQQ